MRTPEPRQHATLLVTDSRAAELRTQSMRWPSWTVTGSQLADLESLLSGLLWPSTGYAARDDRSTVAGPVPSPAPILELTHSVAQLLERGGTLALRDPEGVLLGALHVADVWQENGVWRVSGTVEGVSLPAHHGLSRLRLAPSEVAARAHALGWQRLLAFYSGQVLHAGVRAALTALASQLDAGILLLLPAGGIARDDLSFLARVRALELSANRLPANRALIVITPARVPADPFDAAGLHARVAANYGASAMAIDVTAVPAPSDTLAKAADVAGILLLPLRPWGFDPERHGLADPALATGDHFEPAPPEAQILSWVQTSQQVPHWFLSIEEVEALKGLREPHQRGGFTVFLTGLSGSGKSTIAGALRHRLMEMTGRAVTLLDGDEVRSHLSSELGFSREHRDLNIRRIGWVASEITRHGGMAVCAPIAPYDAVRKQVRRMVEAVGGFVLVHVATPLDVCEQRDRKGLYARARAGLISQFTGIDDPYEEPDDAAVRIDTTEGTVDAACQTIIDWLRDAGYLGRVT